MKILAISLALMGICAIPSIGAVSVNAEDSLEEISEVSSIEEEQSEETTEEEATSESEVATSEEPHKYAYSIKEASISYRDSETASYTVATSESIGNYYLSADGWDEGDENEIYMTIKGNVTTKLESKVVYIYEYKPTVVMFNGAEVECSEDRVYTLTKPSEAGEYDLSIAFTKTIVTNPVDLTHINWASLLTVQNLMTIGSWVVIVVGMIVLYALNQKYKRRGSTSLEMVQKSLSDKITQEYGEEYAKQVSGLLDGIVKPSFEAITAKLAKMDNNQATLVRCLLLMQENTPEARLAITECLSKLDTSEDEEVAKVRAIIEAQQKEYEERTNKRLEAIENANKANEKWTGSGSENKEEGRTDGDYDGTII